MVNVTMKYLQERRSKKLGTISYRYRRPVPGLLKSHLGLGEIVRPLGKTLAATTKAYEKVDKAVDKELAEPISGNGGSTHRAPSAGPVGGPFHFQQRNRFEL